MYKSTERYSRETNIRPITFLVHFTINIYTIVSNTRLWLSTRDPRAKENKRTWINKINQQHLYTPSFYGYFLINDALHKIFFIIKSKFNLMQKKEETCSNTITCTFSRIFVSFQQAVHVMNIYFSFPVKSSLHTIRWTQPSKTSMNHIFRSMRLSNGKLFRQIQLKDIILSERVRFLLHSHSKSIGTFCKWVFQNWQEPLGPKFFFAIYFDLKICLNKSNYCSMKVVI